MIRRANEKAAEKLGGFFSTMTCFWLFVVLATIPLIPQLAGIKDVVFYISSGYIQLIGLPLLAVAGIISETRQAAHRDEIEKQRKEDHERLHKLLNEVHHMHGELHRLVKDPTRMIITPLK